ncbi:diguanylate cyclase domain-containing protein [Pseudomonas saxonica]|uniref:Diguanylate cyclase n=1 Tax=Pseudomonas saxonica TaxID=2600598 RepID=A0A5C5Q1X9_9PSED|nr:diguanylate cyclase [Pseudomonas saxonica]TWR89950.1 diguanylate cyclase [Pseudomonas saxonica]TWR98282.1 diguanylate cyclase [Pseudomonas saxonica]WRQ75889.1 diguanylate cyclase [Pseudomonas saxonica]
MDLKGYLSQVSFIDLLLDAICVVDRNGRFVYVSAACERIFGYEQDELIGQPVMALVHPADRARTLQAAAEIMAGEPKFNFENRYVRKDGRVVHISWSARWSQTYQLRVAVARDITERKNAELRQQAIFAISEAAHGAEDLLELFKCVHMLIGQWLPALNFSVALCDQDQGTISFPYHIDDHKHLQLTEVRVLSEEVIRSGQAVLRCGEASSSWLCVPLVTPSGIIGALVVKSSLGDERYSESHKELLQFVSTQVAAAIERKQLINRLQFLAQYDALTQLPNREFFYERLKSALARAQREQACLAVLFIDLDHFKAVNDNYGHAIGDALLQQIAQRLKQSVRESDTVARMSGDEFVLILESLRQPEDASIVAEKIRQNLSQPLLIEGQTLSIFPSIGFAVYPDHGEQFRQLLCHADTAMYRDKKLRR